MNAKIEESTKKSSNYSSKLLLFVFFCLITLIIFYRHDLANLKDNYLSKFSNQKNLVQESASHTKIVSHPENENSIEDNKNKLSTSSEKEMSLITNADKDEKTSLKINNTKSTSPLTPLIIYDESIYDESIDEDLELIEDERLVKDPKGNQPLERPKTNTPSLEIANLEQMSEMESEQHLSPLNSENKVHENNRLSNHNMHKLPDANSYRLYLQNASTVLNKFRLNQSYSEELDIMLNLFKKHPESHVPKDIKDFIAGLENYNKLLSSPGFSEYRDVNLGIVLVNNFIKIRKKTDEYKLLLKEKSEMEKNIKIFDEFLYSKEFQDSFF